MKTELQVHETAAGLPKEAKINLAQRARSYSEANREVCIALTGFAPKEMQSLCALTKPKISMFTLSEVWRARCSKD